MKDELIEDPSCDGCIYWNRRREVFSETGRLLPDTHPCRCMPLVVNKHKDDWCGQHA